ncbi:hypothetical protein KBY65_07340 [Cyanobium sp. Alchichica 3B3-8F6]|uniref:hypothetical protein n=1 Tax=Cyanobium sp. Alchichica 3B3-8F6 TaxID=2823696 RepID=UPI0020CBB36A|nr:hypothetical protein [Cyanobium sp. Alchichica 3B3-8F6]MCP9882292.1 hypothetical protein [Cyanobium sp. Alchichica 3B3-8F6]
MAFHDLASLPPAAVRAVAQTCEALISAEGKERPTERERELLATLFPSLLGQPWPKDPAATTPVGLSGLVLSRRQRQEVMQLLTLLAFLEPRLDQAKVQLLMRIAVELQVEPETMADLEEVCRGHVLKSFGDMYRRTFHALNNDGVVQGYARFILPMLGVGIDREHESRYAALNAAPAGSLGAGLHAYYIDNNFPYPGSRRGLPYAYVAIHDLHHVIGGYATNPNGELQVLGFTMGLFPDHALLIGLPALLQFQMGIADPLAGSVAPKLKDQLDAPTFAQALQRGGATTGPIRDFHWDFWPWIERPLADVRRELQVL